MLGFRSLAFTTGQLWAATCAHIDSWIQDDNRSELGVLAHCQGQLADEAKVEGVAELHPNLTKWHDLQQETRSHFGLPTFVSRAPWGCRKVDGSLPDKVGAAGHGDNAAGCQAEQLLQLSNCSADAMRQGYPGHVGACRR